MADEHNGTKNPKKQRGRPRLHSEDARSNRLVTFVTDQELAYLKQITINEERSMAFLIHRIVSAHIRDKEKNV